MDLAIAGAMSGAGNAGTQALQQVGQFAGQSFLEQERNKWETARLQLQDQYTRERQQADFAQAKGLLATRESGENTRLGKTLEAHSSDTQKQIDSTKEIHANDLASTERRHASDLALKAKLGEQENALRSKHYDVIGKHYADLATGRKAGGGEGPIDKRQKEFLESVTKPLIDNLTKQLELASPEEKADIQERLDRVVQEARGVAGLSAPEAPAPRQIKDPYENLLNPSVTDSGK